MIVDGKPKIETKTINQLIDKCINTLVFIQVILLLWFMDQSQHFSRNVPCKNYTSMSLPYHVGNGIFWGLLPAISTYLV
jgi:hypothetical protein